MFDIDDRYTTVRELKQGERFFYKDDELMKLPPHCSCYGENCNAVDIKTGTMVDIKEEYLVDKSTMKVELDVYY